MVTAFGIGRVVESTDDKYAKGEIVMGPFLPVAEYCAVPSDFIIRKIEPNGDVELPDYLSCLGLYCPLIHVHASSFCLQVFHRVVM